MSSTLYTLPSLIEPISVLLIAKEYFHIPQQSKKKSGSTKDRKVVKNSKCLFASLSFELEFHVVVVEGYIIFAFIIDMILSLYGLLPGPRLRVIREKA